MAVMVSGTKLQVAAAAAGIYTRQELAEKAGLYPSTITYICGETRGRPVKMGTLGKLAKACGVNPEDLLA